MHKLLLLKCLGLLLPFIGSVVFYNVAVSTPPFHPNLECASCHLMGQGANKANAHQLTSSQEALCGQCHRSALELSHPSGFAPGRKLSKEFPLDWKGDMTCSTCHDIHQGKKGLLLGNKKGKAFCLSCHEQRFFDQMADAGVSIQRRGHLSAAENPAIRELDKYSIQCLECHMERGDAPRVMIDARGILRHAGGSVNHPIGADYARARQKSSYRPISQLKASIIMPQGRISCVSCHLGYSKKHGELAIPNTRSALCMECHDI